MTSAGEGIPEVPVRERGAGRGGDPRENEGSRRWTRREKERKKVAACTDDDDGVGDGVGWCWW